MNMRMVKRATFVGFAVATLGLSIFLVKIGGEAVYAQAPAQQNPNAEAIIKIAEAIWNGKGDDAKKQAEALAKRAAGLNDIMDRFKPRKKNGIGVGKIAGFIRPDGIEQMLIALGRDAPTAAALPVQSPALEEMSYIIAAAAEVTSAMPPAKFDAKQTKKDWMTWSQTVKAGALELAKASRAMDAKDMQAAAAKINAACNSCHAVFRN